ncbi:hypothetical protein HDU76_012246, partial [Blyttiomyces sp. JEL0837]
DELKSREDGKGHKRPGSITTSTLFKARSFADLGFKRISFAVPSTANQNEGDDGIDSNEKGDQKDAGGEKGGEITPAAGASAVGEVLGSWMTAAGWKKWTTAFPVAATTPSTTAFSPSSSTEEAPSLGGHKRSKSLGHKSGAALKEALAAKADDPASTSPASPTSPERPQLSSRQSSFNASPGRPSIDGSSNVWSSMSELFPSKSGSSASISATNVKATSTPASLILKVTETAMAQLGMSDNGGMGPGTLNEVRRLP